MTQHHGDRECQKHHTKTDREPHKALVSEFRYQLGLIATSRGAVSDHNPRYREFVRSDIYVGVSHS